MRTLHLKPTHKVVTAYYDSLAQFDLLNVTHEGAVRSSFQNLLSHCCRQFEWTLVPEFQIKRSGARVDAAVLDAFKLTHGYWEAKDSKDDLEREIKKKFTAGYPKDNILFQEPNRAILWQNNRQILDEDISKADNLIETLKLFLEFQPPEFEQWEQAVEQFKEKIPELAGNLLELIEKERKANKKFINTFTAFMELCRQSVNPNLSDKAVEEMLIQHMLTERIYRKVFRNSDFVRRNVIAHEIEKVIESLTSRAFSREDWLKSLDRFYGAIETTASTIEEFSQKQQFLNTVYEKFFQGFSVKVADTHGIVYTPQPIVNFMVKSVDEILKKEFGKSLSDTGVHILDPFVGTGNFIVRIMQEIETSALPYKYKNELHCNEVMLLPYYIASMNIEHEYFERTSEYEPFEGICLVDTFETSEDKSKKSLFTPENTLRVQKQKDQEIFVVIGNPPYNTNQLNENDNNKNRKYDHIDKRVKETYSKDSQATLVNKLSDPYVKAIRWASDRILKRERDEKGNLFWGGEGIVAFVSNNGFIDGIAFDGMRKHLGNDFSAIYHFNLKGNARTSGERRRREAGNVFEDEIRVGVGVTFFIRKAKLQFRPSDIFIYHVDDYLKSIEKNELLEKYQTFSTVPFDKVNPDKNFTWLTVGMENEFDSFLPLGSKEAKQGKKKTENTFFKTYSLGISTNRDDVVYSFNKEHLAERIQKLCDDYNLELSRYEQKGQPKDIDSFINYEKIKWSSTLKNHVKALNKAMFDVDNIRFSTYRPFQKLYLYYNSIFIDRPALFDKMLSNIKIEKENKLICLRGGTSNKTFHCLMTNTIPDLHFTGDSQCFPYYIYDEDGTNRRENITDWVLEEFKKQYAEKEEQRKRKKTITKWDIFYYVYAILHHPHYREKYAANLRRELPRIPFAPVFWEFAKAGKELADLHVNYESQKEYPLKKIESPDKPLNWRVEKMRLSKDKTCIEYNEFLKLEGIPPEALNYRLGNRSALEWVIDQYQVSTDKRSGITNDPNREEDPEYIFRLLGKVITVSLETERIITAFPPLD